MSSIKLKTKLVKPSFIIKIKQEQKNLIDYILDELKDVDVKDMKHDPEFLKYLADLIENQITQEDDQGNKVTKMDVFVEIMRRLFPAIKDEELDSSKRIVEYLLKNQLVSKTKLSSVMKFFFKKTVPSFGLVGNIANKLIFTAASNVIQNKVLYPVMMQALHNKAVVVLLLTFL